MNISVSLDVPLPEKSSREIMYLFRLFNERDAYRTRFSIDSILGDNDKRGDQS